MTDEVPGVPDHYYPKDTRQARLSVEMKWLETSGETEPRIVPISALYPKNVLENPNNKIVMIDLEMLPAQTVILDFLTGIGTVNGVANAILTAKLQNMLCKARDLTYEFDNELVIYYDDTLTGHWTRFPTAGQGGFSHNEYELTKLILVNPFPVSAKYANQVTQVSIQAAGWKGP